MKPGGHGGKSRIVVTITNVWDHNNITRGGLLERTWGVTRTDRPKSKRGTLPKSESGTLSRTREDIKKKTLFGSDADPNSESGFFVLPDEPGAPSLGDGRKRLPTSFDYRAAEELAKVISKRIKVNCNANMKEWADQIRLMRERDKVSKADIRRTIKWYSEHINDEYAIEAFSAGTFRDKYRQNKFAAAMTRTSREQEQTRTRVQEATIQRVLSMVDEKALMMPSTQDQLDVLLKELGRPAGEIRPQDLRS
jgi:uncharacterized coiled-coil protein SlyX